MRKLLIFILFIEIVSCQQTTKLTSDFAITINAEKIRTFDSTYFFTHDTVRLTTFLVRISVKNISDHAVDFYTMNCTWCDNFVINKENFNILAPNDCPSNHPDGYHLPPNQSKTYDALLIKSSYDTMNMTERNLKLGFIFIDSTAISEYHNLKDILGDKSLQRIIWSNPLDIK